MVHTYFVTLLFARVAHVDHFLIIEMLRSGKFSYKYPASFIRNPHKTNIKNETEVHSSHQKNTITRLLISKTFSVYPHHLPVLVPSYIESKVHHNNTAKYTNSSPHDIQAFICFFLFNCHYH